MPMSTKRKAPAKLAAPVVKTSAKLSNKATIDESRTSVSGPDAVNQSSQVEMIEISSDGDSDSDEDVSDVEGEEEEEQVNGNDKHASQSASLKDQSLARVNNKKDALSPAKNAEADSDDEATSPSFGELLRGNEAIDVPSLLQQASAASNTLAQPARTAIVPPSHQSLTTVLSQALRTDDVDLLESCLHTTDLPTIRNTIQNIDSALAGTLLTKLASRLYRRPGRAGNLMTWVQWTLIAHGGALASQPKVIQGLNGLQKVLAERAKGLNSLLALKGKLDMLEGQMDLRKKMIQHGSKLGQNDEEEEEEDVIWVEGEDNDTQASSNRRRNADEDDEDDDVPITNGFVGDSDDEEDDEDVPEDESDAAEESLDEDEVDHDDVDESMGEDEESDVDAAPPSKLQKTAGAFSKRK